MSELANIHGTLSVPCHRILEEGPKPENVRRFLLAERNWNFAFDDEAKQRAEQYWGVAFSSEETPRCDAFQMSLMPTDEMNASEPATKSLRHYSFRYANWYQTLLQLGDEIWTKISQSAIGEVGRYNFTLDIYDVEDVPRKERPPNTYIDHLGSFKGRVSFFERNDGDYCGYTREVSVEGGGKLEKIFQNEALNIIDRNLKFLERIVYQNDAIRERELNPPPPKTRLQRAAEMLRTLAGPTQRRW